jgi:NAD(P)-dependent dehydrogenase (short-subunit alcohol dehydrogenase family)
MGAAMRVAGKVVVVTGGANGIGKALCEEFYRAGAAKLIVADIDVAAARTVAASVQGAAFKCDVGQEKDILHVIERPSASSARSRCSAPMPASAAASIPCR